MLANFSKIISGETDTKMISLNTGTCVPYDVDVKPLEDGSFIIVADQADVPLGSFEGQMEGVSDAAAAPVYNATATGGGSVHIPVYCNGTNWTNH